MSAAPSDPKCGYLSIYVMCYEVQDSTGKPQLTKKDALKKCSFISQFLELDPQWSSNNVKANNEREWGPRIAPSLMIC